MEVQKVAIDHGDRCIVYIYIKQMTEFVQVNKDSCLVHCKSYHSYEKQNKKKQVKEKKVKAFDIPTHYSYYNIEKIKLHNLRTTISTKTTGAINHQTRL